MLVPGEPVTVYGGPDGENPLLINSAQRGRAFLGTMQGRSTVQPGPVTPLDEKVSAATLAGWARVGRLNDLLKPQWGAWLLVDRGGRLPGGDSRHVPRGYKIPGDSR